jgi:hypothetical protein
MDSLPSILKELQEYYKAQLTPVQAKVYIRNLSDLDLTMLRQGADYLIQQGSPFMPKVAELRKAANRFTPLPQGKPENADYWRAMSIFNDVRLEMPPELEKYIVCQEREVKDAAPG